MGTEVAIGWELGGCGNFVEGSSKGRRRIAEGSPKGRRKRILADINARPPDKRELGNFRDRIAIHNGRDGAGQEKKRKSPPKEKKPPTKKEKPLLAAPLAYGRLRRPPLSLLFSLPSAAAPPPFLALSALLSPLVGGCAAPPLCFSSRASFGRLRRPTPSASLPFLRRLRRLSPTRSRGRLAPPPLSPLSFLSIK